MNKITLTASSSQDVPSGQGHLAIYDLTTRARLGFTRTASTLSVTTVPRGGTTEISQAAHQYIAVVARSVPPTWPATRLLAQSAPVPIRAWTSALSITPTSTGSTLTATGSYDVPASNYHLAIYDLTTTARLGYTRTSSTLSVADVPTSHRYVAVVAGGVPPTWPATNIAASSIGLMQQAGAAIPLEQTYGSGCDRFARNWSSSWGYPVNTASGAETLHVKDAQLPGPGIPCELSRSYTSLDTRAGPLGRGWTHSLNAQLLLDEPGVVTYRGPGGQQARFAVDPAGGYTPAVGVPGELIADAGGGWQLVYPDRRTFAFDSGGRLTSVVDRTGTGLTLSYLEGVLSSVTGAGGRTLQFEHDAQGLMTRVTLPDGRYVAYSYANGLLVGVRDLRGQMTTYAYDSAGRMRSMRDPLGNEVLTRYDEVTGRVVSQTDPRGFETTFALNPTTQAVTVTRPDGGVWVEAYDGNVLVSRKDPAGHLTEYVYDSQVNLVGVRDALGRVTSMAYDERGNVVSRTSPPVPEAPAGHTETWTYNTANDVTSHTDGRGGTTTYVHTAAGLVQTATDTAGGVTEYLYNGQGQVTSITDPRQAVTTMTYSAAGDLVATVSPSGARQTFDYDAVGRLTRTVGPLGNITGNSAVDHATNYVYDDGDLLTMVTDPAGAVTQYGYDAVGRQVSSTDPLGRESTHVYDEAGNPISMTDPAGAVLSMAYDPVGHVVERTTPAGRTTTTFDTRGNLLTETSPRGNAAGASPADFTWTHTYDAAGNETSVTDPLGNPTFVDYDGLNRTTAVVDARGNRTSTTYDANGNSVTTTRADGATTTRAFDALDRVTSESDPRDSSWVTSYQYLPTGQLATRTDAGGARWTWDYDPAGRLVREVDPRGNAAGAAPDDFATTHSYDAADRLTRTVDPLGHATSYQYDAAGRTTSVTDPRGAVTSYAYLRDGALESVTGPAGTGTTAYTYDAAGNFAARTDPSGQTTEHSYDLDRRLTRTTGPDGRTWTYAYDAAGNPTEAVTPMGTGTTEAGDGTIRTAYDALDRVTGVDYSDATPDVTYAYDQVGNRQRMTDGVGTATYAYDMVDRLTSVDRDGDVIGYGYDAAGNVTARTYPDGTQLNATYDPAGHLAVLTRNSATHASYTYDPAGRPATAVMGNGVTHRWSSDQAGRTTGVSTSTADQVLTSVTADLDPSGNPTRLVTTVPSAPATSTASAPAVRTDGYSYDPAGRVARHCPAMPSSSACDQSTAASTTYAYDPVGNRVQETRQGLPGAPVTTYGYDAANQAVSVTRGEVTTALTSDANGNTTRDASGRTYRTDLAGHLRQVTTPSLTLDYGYDGDGTQLSHTATTADAPPSVSRLVLDPLFDVAQPIAQRGADPGSEWTRSWVHGVTGTGPLSITSTSSSSAATGWVHPGWLGTPLAVSTDTAQVSATTDYDLFGVGTWSALDGTSMPDWATTSGMTTGGNAPLAVAGVLGPFGEISDPATAVSATDSSAALVHLRARTMDPATGRFLATDPLTPPITSPYITAYAYADNRPGVLTDPTGLWPEWPSPTGQQQRDAWRGVGDAAWDIGPGTVSFLARWGTLPGYLGYVDPLDRIENDTKNRLDTWGGGRTDTCTNQLLYGGLSAAAIALPGPTGKTNLARGVGRVDAVLPRIANASPPRFITTGAGVTIDRLAVNAKTSRQRQARHVVGTRQYQGASYFNSSDDAQRVLNDFHNGGATILGTKGNDIVIRSDSVTGYNHNPRSGFRDQRTNVFFIKGSSSPSVVPYNPAWLP